MVSLFGQKLTVSIYSYLAASDCHESLEATGPNSSNDDQQSFNDRLLHRTSPGRLGHAVNLAAIGVHSRRAEAVVVVTDPHYSGVGEGNGE